MPQAPLETKQGALDALKKLEEEYKALPSHEMDYRVTSLASDSPHETTVTHNFYISITFPKPTEPTA